MFNNAVKGLLLAILLGSNLLSGVFAQTPAQEYVIHAGHLINGIDKTVKEKMTVVVRDNRIVKVSTGFIEPGAHQALIDLREHTVMPGLMDMHTHLSFAESSPKSYTERFFMNATDYALRASHDAKNTLMAGFTTVRDLGEPQLGITLALKNAIKEGYIQGPRIYTATKSIATTGGHADPTNGLNNHLMHDPGPKEGVINGADDARKAVRQRYKEGADLIKLTVTGGVLSMAKSGENPQFTDEELQGIMQAAKDYGFTVAVHAHGAEGMKRAIKAGVDSVEHGTFMDEEAIRLMKKYGTYYVPTILAGKWVAEKAADPEYYPAVVRPKALEVGPKIQNTFAKAYKSGVQIAFGTDSGVSPHGMNAREFVYMVEAGMPPMEAIQSATIHSARLLRIDDKLGSLEAGKLADLIAVKGDPLKDISLMQHVDFVMKDGVVVKQANP